MKENTKDIVKVTVKENKANGQFFGNFPKGVFKDGDVVYVQKVKETTEKDLKDFYKKNKDNLEDCFYNIKNNVLSSIVYRPASIFMEWYKDNFNIEVKQESEDNSIRCNDTWVSFDDPLYLTTDISDHDNYIQEIGSEESFDEVIGLASCIEYTNDGEAWIFKKDGLNKKHIDNSNHINKYLELQRHLNESLRHDMKFYFEDIGFYPFGYGSDLPDISDEFHEAWKHKELDIYILIPNTINNKVFNMELCIDNAKSEKIEIGGKK